MFVGVWGVRVEIQISKRKFHIYIHLNYVRVKFLFYINKKIKNKIWVTHTQTK